MATIKDSTVQNGSGQNGQLQQPNQSEGNDDDDTIEKSSDEGTALTRVTDIMSENSSAAALWKTALSGALDEKRLLFGLVVLSLFYVVYINVSAYQNGKSKDEDAITHNCTCRSDHRSFYLAWSAFCFLVWTTIHIILAFPQIKQYSKGFLWKNRNYNNQHTQRSDKKFCCKPKWFSKEMLHSKYWCSKLDRGCRYLCCNKDGSYTAKHIDNPSYYSNFIMSCIKLKKSMHMHNAIHRYEYYLWTKYYELYVVGITKEDEKFSLQSIDKFIGDAMGAPDVTDGSRNNKPAKSETREPESKATIYTALSHIQERCCSFGVQAFLHMFLALVLFLAQLAVIPLLMIQVFDTYAFLCLAADNYCTMESQFTLHFHQTVVTFAFYCSLMVSFLASNMLRWVPWPRKDPQLN